MNATNEALAAMYEREHGEPRTEEIIQSTRNHIRNRFPYNSA